MTVTTDRPRDVMGRSKSAFLTSWFPSDMCLLDLKYPVKGLRATIKIQAHTDASTDEFKSEEEI